MVEPTILLAEVPKLRRSAIESPSTTFCDNKNSEAFSFCITYKTTNYIPNTELQILTFNAPFRWTFTAERVARIRDEENMVQFSFVQSQIESQAPTETPSILLVLEKDNLDSIGVHDRIPY